MWKGSITESLLNSMPRLCFDFDNEDLIIGYIS